MTELRDMMGHMKIAGFTALGSDVSRRDLAQLNRLLSRVKRQIQVSASCRGAQRSAASFLS